MPMEAALLESRTLRESVAGRVDVLDKVKALELLPDGLHLTARLLADYFEVGERAINAVVTRHRAELQENGYTVLKGTDLQDFLSFNMQLRKVPGAGLGIFPRRAVLNVAMLLRDSEVARRVRRYLLDAEAAVRRSRAGSSFDYAEMVDELERRLLAGTVGDRLARCEGMLLADRGLVRAMSLRLCEVAADVRAARADVAQLRRGRWVWRR
ncbi:hypothetical protein GCM10009760_11700 [Kitasatospora kazusensis]|uniref:Uncharacterized protein n=1 Tax=Kitasatospora kazusensis TaxID=407974 RepID=A0ABN2YZB5_9ACTN